MNTERRRPIYWALLITCAVASVWHSSVVASAYVQLEALPLKNGYTDKASILGPIPDYKGRDGARDYFLHDAILHQRNKMHTSFWVSLHFAACVIGVYWLRRAEDVIP